MEKKNNIKPYTRVGQVHFAETKHISKDAKSKRRYVVVKDDGENIKVSRLNSIKKIDSTGKNVDEALIEIDSSYPGLTKRTGVDYEVYHKNRLSNQKLKLDRMNGFEEAPEFVLTEKDKAKVKSHVHLRGGVNKRRR